MATMSTASRTAWTSCGVRLTLPRGMLEVPEQSGGAADFVFVSAGVAQGDHRCAVAALVRGAGTNLLDRRVAAQVLPYRLAQAPGAVAVDHPHLAPRGQEGAVEIAVELLQGRLDPHPHEIALGGHRPGLAELAPRPAPP